jgi:signal transduction histidine kinase
LEQADSNSKSIAKVEPLIEIEPLSNWTVMVDKAGLRRILINLIGNSMKFTQASTLFISFPAYLTVLISRMAMSG